MFPLCRSLTGDGVRSTFDLIERGDPDHHGPRSPAAPSVLDWIVPDEWNIRDALHHGPRRHPRRRRSPTRPSTSSPTASRCTPRCRSSALRERLHTLPDQPGPDPVPDLLLRPHLGLLPPAQPADRAPGRATTRWSSTRRSSRATSPTRSSLIEGEGSEARCWSRPTSATPRSPTTTSRGSPSRRCSPRELLGPPAAPHLPLPVRPGNDRPARLAGPQPRRPGPDRARACALLHRRRRRPHLQAQPPRRRRGRPGDGGRPARHGRPHRILPWEPWGGDERQFCSPGFDLPMGTLMRTPHGEFDGYHTSADALERIRPESLAEAVETCLDSSKCSRPTAAAPT